MSSTDSLVAHYPSLNWQGRKDLREKYVIAQKGACSHCKKLLSNHPSIIVDRAYINWDLFPPNFLRYPIHLHHNHDTGMTIGAVHAKCNAYMWQYLGE